MVVNRPTFLDPCTSRSKFTSNGHNNRDYPGVFTSSLKGTRDDSFRVLRVVNAYQISE